MPPREALGVLAMKFVVMFLLPFGPVAGMAVMECIPRHLRDGRGPQMFILLGVLVCFACQMSWLLVFILDALGK